MALESTMRMFGESYLTPSIKAPLVSDMQLDFRTSYETLFLLTELSDAMRRGVRHYKLDGTALDEPEQRGPGAHLRGRDLLRRRVQRGAGRSLTGG